MMRCPDCSHDLDSVPVEEPCPNCGGMRRDAIVIAPPAVGRISIRATAVGHAISNDAVHRIDAVLSRPTVKSRDLLVRTTAPDEEAPGWFVELRTSDGNELLGAAQSDDLADAALAAAMEMERVLSQREEPSLREPHKNELEP